MDDKGVRIKPPLLLQDQFCVLGQSQESEKADLKLNIQKTKIMISGPTNLSQIDGGKVETVTDFVFLRSKITADSDYSQEIKR